PPVSSWQYAVSRGIGCLRLTAYSHSGVRRADLAPAHSDGGRSGGEADSQAGAVDADDSGVRAGPGDALADVHLAAFVEPAQGGQLYRAVQPDLRRRLDSQ